MKSSKKCLVEDQTSVFLDWIHQISGLEVSVFVWWSAKCGLQYKLTFGFQWERKYNNIIILCSVRRALYTLDLGHTRVVQTSL